MAEWPSNHQIALQVIRNQQGRILPRSNLIASSDVHSFGQAILEACNNNPNLSWAKDAFFIHQIKGVKAAFSSDVDDVDLNDIEEGWNRTALLENFLEFFDYDFAAPFDQAFIDVGLEFSIKDHVLHWDKNAHKDIVDFVIENSPAASKLTKPNVWDATYIQAYCTDKHLSTSADQDSVAKHVQVSDILLDSPVYKKTIGDILDQCSSAVHNKLSANARLEVRVPLKHGPEVLPYMNTAVMQSCLLVYKSSTWW